MLRSKYLWDVLSEIGRIRKHLDRIEKWILEENGEIKMPGSYPVLDASDIGELAYFMERSLRAYAKNYERKRPAKKTS